MKFADLKVGETYIDRGVFRRFSQFYDGDPAERLLRNSFVLVDPIGYYTTSRFAVKYHPNIPQFASQKVDGRSNKYVKVRILSRAEGRTSMVAVNQILGLYSEKADEVLATLEADAVERDLFHAQEKQYRTQRQQVAMPQLDRILNLLNTEQCTLNRRQFEYLDNTAISALHDAVFFISPELFLGHPNED